MSLLISLLLVVGQAAAAAPPAAMRDTTAPPPVPIAGPVNVKAFDTPSDEGKSITITWQASPAAGVELYEIQRAEVTAGKAGEFSPLDKVPATEKSYADEGTDDKKSYRYRVVARRGTDSGYAESSIANSYPQLFNLSLLNVIVAMAVIFFFILYFIYQARKGKKLYVRRIAGLDAVEDAVGRATEMGRPILFVPGIGDVSAIATIASLNILGEIAKKTAQYGTDLIVPNSNPVVYTVAREMVKEAHTKVGRPDTYKPDNIFFITTEQFAYAAAVDGIMVRDKPATNFLLGFFLAESLILAETGTMIGAIQIAGTDQPTQLPFFITACDYTLIGEELYAASAYLSHEPLLLGSLVGQDYGKMIIVIVVLLGSLLYLLSAVKGLNWLSVVWQLLRT